mgnify:CR=1 FL=1
MIFIEKHCKTNDSHESGCPRDADTELGKIQCYAMQSVGYSEVLTAECQIYKSFLGHHEDRRDLPMCQD